MSVCVPAENTLNREGGAERKDGSGAGSLPGLGRMLDLSMGQKDTRKVLAPSQDGHPLDEDASSDKGL